MCFFQSSEGPPEPVLAILFHLAQMPFPISISSLLGFPFPSLLFSPYQNSQITPRQQALRNSFVCKQSGWRPGRSHEVSEEVEWEVGRWEGSMEPGCLSVWWLEERSAWVSQVMTFSSVCLLPFPVFFPCLPFTSFSLLLWTIVSFLCFPQFWLFSFPVTSALFAQFIPCQVCREQLT